MVWKLSTRKAETNHGNARRNILGLASGFLPAPPTTKMGEKHIRRLNMARYLAQIDPARAEQVKSSLGTIKVGVISQAFDYWLVDIPPELIPKVRVIPGVITVRPEGKVTTLVNLLDFLPALPFQGQPLPKFLVNQMRATLPPGPMPIEKKLARFIELARNPLTLPQAFAFAAAADEGIERWPTGESRKVVGADVAEAEGITGKGIKVAVIDTGAVPTAQGHYLDLGSKSSVEGQPIPWDENGHGTHCASTISGSPFQTPFGLLKGVAPDCQVLVVKCLGYGLGAGTDTSVLRAMMDAFEWGADLISASLGSEYSEEPTDKIPNCRAVRMLTNAGVINVWANGNSGPEPRTVGVPACEPSALSVGAIDKRGKIASFSSRGMTQENLIKPDVVAPGVNITSSSTGLIALMQAGRDFPGTASISGTSMSTPHVAGLCALTLQYARMKGKKLTTDGIKEAMSLYGEYAGSKNNDYGYGLITWQILKRYVDERL